MMAIITLHSFTKRQVNSQYNAKANRELRKYIKSTLSADEIFDKMEKYFSMQFKDAGSKIL